MKIGIVGLGLIGGSFAKAAKEYTQNEVLGFDKSDVVIKTAILEDAIDGVLDKENLCECDVLLLALYPSACVAYLEEHAEFIKKGATVIDLCGVKRAVCAPCFDIARRFGFRYVGGHPMAGTQTSGFRSSRPTMFKNASMIYVLNDQSDISTMAYLKGLALSFGFAKVVFCSAEEHDRIIAYTSQLAHVVSGAFIKSPSSVLHKGFSAGSFKDMTRVAALNEDLWCELFFDNADNLSAELGRIIDSLQEYKSVLDSGDRERMHALLREGRECKERSDQSISKAEK